VLIPPYPATLARVREVIEFHGRWYPGFPPRSVELADCTRSAARAAVHENVPLATLAADLGRLATEVLGHAPGAAVEAVWAMARWASREYQAVVDVPSAASTRRRDERRLTGRRIAAGHVGGETLRRPVAADH
jgi:hypothetical protein